MESIESIAFGINEIYRRRKTADSMEPIYSIT